MVRSAPAQNTRGSALASTTGTPGSAASASVSERSRLTSSALRRSGRDRRTQRKPAGLVSTTRWGCAMLRLPTAVDSRNAAPPKRLKYGIPIYRASAQSWEAGMTTQGHDYTSKTDLVAALIRELIITGELATG